MTNPSPTNQPADSRLRKRLKEWFDEVYQTNTADDRLPRDIAEYTLERIFDCYSQEIAREARLAGKREIIAIGRERLDNDDTYMLEAFIEDVESYLEKLTKQSAEGVSDEYK